MKSHYVREKSKHQFLASNLNIHSMYELYQSEKDIEVKVGEQTYGNIFSTCFNLSFHKPKKIAVKLALSSKIQLLNKRHFQKRNT